MDKLKAEDIIYQSYVKAQQFQDYETKDANKRRVDLLYASIQELSQTPCVVITGSKGKGSVASMIAQMLQVFCKVGLMTSPHLVEFQERFQIDGCPISEADFVKQVAHLQPIITEIDRKLEDGVCISPIGIQAMLALRYFYVNKTDFNVFECGKGAKYDDVNSIKHAYAVINRIFLEHTRELGSTLEEIAMDKSHVIQKGQTCVYVAKQDEQVMKIIKKRAKEQGVPLKIYGEDFYADHIRYSKDGMQFNLDIEGVQYQNFVIPLLGEHQAMNCALAFALFLDIQKTMNREEIQLEEVKGKLKRLDWPGRMEVISTNPFILLDACINRESCGHVKSVLKHLGIKKVTLLVGIPDDKDYNGVVQEMNQLSKRVVLVKSENPHYKFTTIQQQVLEEEGIKTQRYEQLDEAIRYAIGKEEPIVILGTTSVVAQVKSRKEHICTN